MSEIVSYANKGGPDAIMHTPTRINPVAMALAKLAENPTPENVASMAKLTELGIQYRKMDAEEEFNAALSEMQLNMPQIVCDTLGPWGGYYADRESIMRQIRPTLNKFGFFVRFDHPASPDPQKLVTECVLSHRGGHSVRNSMITRAGRPNKMMTEIQVDAGGYYAGERYALCAMLTIRAETGDDDARILGVELTTEQLTTLQTRVKEVGMNPKIVFRMADVEKWEDIRSGALGVINGMLREKEMRNKVAKNAPDNSAAAGAWVYSRKEAEIREWVNSFGKQTIEAACAAVQVDGVSAAHSYGKVQAVAVFLKRRELDGN